MNILSIGNSFSQDATRYLHQIAHADGVDINCFNLYIGACSFFRHFKNMKGNLKEYMLEMNGKSTGFLVTLKEALINREWDVITIQQVSTESVDFANYKPYIYELVDYIKEHSPKAKIYIHQTWAYESGSKRINELGYEVYDEMLKDIKIAYEQAEIEISADGIIPSGEMIGCILHNGIENVYRDTFHLKLGIGRYAAGLLWYKVLTGNSVLNNSFCDFDEEVSESEKETVQKIIEEQF